MRSVEVGRLSVSFCLPFPIACVLFLKAHVSPPCFPISFHCLCASSESSCLSPLLSHRAASPVLCRAHLSGIVSLIASRMSLQSRGMRLAAMRAASSLCEEAPGVIGRDPKGISRLLTALEAGGAIRDASVYAS